MAGHSHWAGIKHQKEVADKKRGVLFSKLLVAITAAAKTEPNPDFNPRLRTAVQKAREGNVPADNIERAIKRASENKESLDELLFEAYGPGGAALLIEVITSSRNRSVQEIKKILSDNDGKWAEPGSVQWAFGRDTDGRGWNAKFPQEITPGERKELALLVEALHENTDVQHVTTNATV